VTVIRYRCKCENCKHEWTSHRDTGTPNQCPRPHCRSRLISMRPLIEGNRVVPVWGPICRLNVPVRLPKYPAEGSERSPH
jgi:hypothetical protein